MVFGEIVTVNYPYCFTKISAKKTRQMQRLKARQMQRLLEKAQRHTNTHPPLHTQTQKCENNEKQ